MYNGFDMKYVIYDFNGTVLDDTEVCLKAENYTIEHFGLDRPPLTMDEYLHIFTFPVQKYYENVGFDWSKNSYAEVGQYWFDWYRALRDEYKVHEGVIEVLKKSRELGYINILLSASSLVELKKQLEELGIEEYFDEVLGIDNIYAGSKIDIALPLGSAVSTRRNDVHYVVTEYGIVNLRYRTIEERVKAMISIAHPEFRDRLTFQAKKEGLLY